MPNHAPEYTTRERITFVLKHMLWFIPLVAATELWFFDWLSEYADNANCYIYGSITGVHLIMYGLFVGIPLSLVILLSILEGRRAIKVIKLGQNPLPGEKVFKKTKYTYGHKAKVKPVGIIFSIGFLLALTIWGVMQAHELTQNIKPCTLSLTSQAAMP